MKFECLFLSKVVNTRYPFNTLIPVIKGEVGVLHIYLDSFLD